VITPVALSLWAKRPSIPGLSDVSASGGFVLAPVRIDVE
jgi:hypothetical protein